MQYPAVTGRWLVVYLQVDESPPPSYTRYKRPSVRPPAMTIKSNRVPTNSQPGLGQPESGDNSFTREFSGTSEAESEDDEGEANVGGGTGGTKGTGSAG